MNVALTTAILRHASSKPNAIVREPKNETGPDPMPSAEVTGFATERELMLAQAADETIRGLAKHGSIDKWPTLLLQPKEFKLCLCGCFRSGHKLAGTDRARCMTPGCKCLLFEAKITASDRRRMREMGGGL